MSKRIVVKVGTSVLTAGKSRLHKPGMADIVRQLAELHDEGCEIILCSSGAIQAGRDRLGWKAKPRTVAEKQMLAALQLFCRNRFNRLRKGGKAHYFRALRPNFPVCAVFWPLRRAGVG